MFYILALFFYILILLLKFMPKITYKDKLGNSKTLEVEKGLSVMEGAIQNDVPGIDADCGGSMACATCHVYVEEKWLDKLPKAEDGEIDMIDMAFEPKKIADSVVK